MKHYRDNYAPVDDVYRYCVDLITKVEKLELAEDLIHTLLLNDKNSPVLMFQIGNIKMKQNLYAFAEVFYQKVLEKLPDFPECYMNLGYVLKEMERIDEARAAFKKAIDIVERENRTAEEISDYYHNYASTFSACGEPHQCIEFANKAISLNSNKEDAYWNRGLAYLEIGDYEKGFQDYDHGVRITDTKNRRYTIDPTPFWDGTPGKTVVIYGEQGIGDELMFGTMIEDIMKDCAVVLDMHPRLQKLFQNTYPQLSVFGTRKMGGYQWPKYYSVDAKLSIGSLAKFYRKKREDFPGKSYLQVPMNLIEKYRYKLAEISPKKKIGISWKGGNAKTNQCNRKIKLKEFLPLLELDEHFDFISLQYHEDSQTHIDVINRKCGKKIHHWQDVMDDYDETAGLVANLDYIISVPQSVVHLAGAIGTPTLQLCPKKAMWQMGVYGENMPWYSCVENAWQEEAGDWEPTIQKAKEKLCSLLQTTT
jgi:tetratricopeptide (TPR) repeat protein